MEGKNKFSLASPARQSRKSAHPLSRFKLSISRQQSARSSVIDLEKGLSEKSAVTVNLSLPSNSKANDEKEEGEKKTCCCWLWLLLLLLIPLLLWLMSGRKKKSTLLLKVGTNAIA